MTSLCYFKVNGKLFVTSTSLQPSVYRDNKIYTVTDAFKEKLLSPQNIDAFYNDYYSLNKDSLSLYEIERRYNASKYEEGSSGILSFYEYILIDYGPILIR